jgi:rod shape-determining protein MreD
MRALWALVAIGLAIALQTTLDVYFGGSVATVDLVLVAVVYVALTSGPVGGMLAGSVAGLIQDALAAPVIGIGGLAKSIVGFFAGAFAQQFIVTSALPRLVIFAVATLVHTAVFNGMYIMLGLRAFPSPWASIAGQAIGNALVGTIAVTAIEAVPGVIERRRLERRGRH